MIDKNITKKRVRRLTGWVRRRVELAWLISLGLVALGGGAFVSIADEVMEGETHALDSAILLALRSGEDRSPLGPLWLQETASDITALGGYPVLTLVTAATLGFLLLMRHPRLAGVLLGSVAGGMALSMVLKLGFDRQRPDLVPHVVPTHTASFPSGHAMLSAIVWLTMAALVARAVPLRRGRAYVVGVGIFVALLVGCSRVYLGVHWPTDVLAGWAMGAAWAVLAWLAASAVQTHAGTTVTPRDDGD